MKDNLVACKVCQEDIDAKAILCPKCRGNNKPLLMSWYNPNFIIAVVLILVFAFFLPIGTPVLKKLIWKRNTGVIEKGLDARIINHKLVYDNNDFRIIGEIKNTGSKSITYGKLEAIFKNNKGEVTKIAKGYFWGAFKPSEIKYFEVGVFNTNNANFEIEEYQKYEIKIIDLDDY